MLIEIVWISFAAKKLPLWAMFNSVTTVHLQGRSSIAKRATSSLPEFFSQITEVLGALLMPSYAQDSSPFCFWKWLVLQNVFFFFAKENENILWRKDKKLVVFLPYWVFPMAKTCFLNEFCTVPACFPSFNTHIWSQRVHIQFHAWLLCRLLAAEGSDQDVTLSRQEPGGTTRRDEDDLCFIVFRGLPH